MGGGLRWKGKEGKRWEREGSRGRRVGKGREGMEMCGKDGRKNGEERWRGEEGEGREWD